MSIDVPAPDERAEADITEVMPPERADYLRSVESKHFGKSGPAGSRFTAVESLRDLLSLATAQRGSLEGDDRQRLIEAGVSEGALLPQCRYLLVETPGEMGIVRPE